MEVLDLFSQSEPQERDCLVIYNWCEYGECHEYTIPRSVKRQGVRASREYIRKNNIFKRPYGSTPLSATWK